jgi:hypothetical protein
VAPVEVRIRRVVIGFADSGAAVGNVIATAAEFARVLEVELWGLFIEDALVFAAAEWPHQRAIAPRALEWRALTAAGNAEAHVLAARAVERHLLGEAAALGIAAGFQIVRGEPAAALTQRLEPSDLLVFAEPADPIARVLPPYPRLVRALHETAAGVLYVPHGARRKSGPVVAFAQSANDPALELATSVAAALHERLIVLAMGGAAAEQAIAQAARERTAGAVTLRLDARGTDRWHDAAKRALERYRERVLVVSRAAVAGDLARYLRLAGERAAPLLLAPAG